MASAIGEVVTVVAPRAEGWPRDLVDCYEQHASPLTGYLLSLVGDLALAQDLTQESFVRLFAKWRHVEHPRAYVYLTGLNLARQQWRRSSRERLALGSVHRLDPDTSAGHDPWLRDLVDRLPKRLRTPVLLHYYADLPLEQVSAVMHLPLGTTKRRLHEARTILREILESAHA